MRDGPTPLTGTTRDGIAATDNAIYQVRLLAQAIVAVLSGK